MKYIHGYLFYSTIIHVSREWNECIKRGGFLKIANINVENIDIYIKNFVIVAYM